MAITRATNPIDDSTIVMATGVVERIVIKEAERTAKNLEYGVTHIASIVVDGQWINYISLGIKEGKEPNIAINTGTKDSPKWVQIQETDEVKVIVTEKVVGDKTYYSAKRTGIKLVKKNATPCQATQQQTSAGSASNYQAKPKDMSGISVGHSFNGAMNFITTYGQDNSNENIVAVAKKVHDVTERVKAEYAKANPEMSAYDSGAAAGNSVLNACKLVGVEGDFEEGVYALAMDFLNNVVPKIMSYVKEGSKEQPAAVKTTRANPTKKNATKATSVMEPLEKEMDNQDLPF
ncbi:MAG: hypothetical protein ACRCVU_20295 [Flavobacterium sp.]